MTINVEHVESTTACLRIFLVTVITASFRCFRLTLLLSVRLLSCLFVVV